MATPKNNQVPEGFEQYDTSMATSWDWDKEGPVRGIVVRKKDVTFHTKQGEEVRRCLVLDVDGVKRGVWEAAALKDFFDECEPGEEVYIAPEGIEKLEGGRTMRQFTVAKR